MRQIAKFCLLLILIIFVYSPVFCEEDNNTTIYLISGNQLSGRLVMEGGKEVYLEVPDGSRKKFITIKYADIDRIENNGQVKQISGAIALPENNKQGKEAESNVPVSENKKITLSPPVAKPAGLTGIKINPLVELDFKTKAEIYALRKSYVMQYPQLVNQPYEPSEEVFGQIVDNKPWWGILGISYYGPGEMSIAGESEESRHLANPFILVGLEDPWAYILKESNLKPKAIYPQPISLVWRLDRTYAKVKYDISSFWQQGSEYKYRGVAERNLYLVAYNARDLGFKYLYVAPEKSQAIVSSNSVAKAVAIPFFIHLGGSCGYPGGCNNMSPSAPEFNIRVDKLPASAYVKLWRDMPDDTTKDADMIFVIEMI